jgi:hypothetical protein
MPVHFHFSPKRFCLTVFSPSFQLFQGLLTPELIAGVSERISELDRQISVSRCQLSPN